MKKFIIVLVVLFFILNFEIVYGQASNCQDDTEIMSLKQCVMDKINYILGKITEAKNSLENFSYGLSYRCISFGSCWDSSKLLSAISLFRDYLNNYNSIINNIINNINTKTRYANYKCTNANGEICESSFKSIFLPHFHLDSDFIFLGGIATRKYHYSDYGLSIILEDNMSAIHLSITNEGKGRFSTETVATRTLKFLDNLSSYLTYLKSYYDIGYYIEAFSGETACSENLRIIRDKINNATSIEYIKKIDKHINIFINSTIKTNFLTIFDIVKDRGIVGGFFGEPGQRGVYQFGSYYRVGVYLHNISTAANEIKQKASEFVKAYNLYNESCNTEFFEKGVTIRSRTSSTELENKMRNLVQNFSPHLIYGQMKVEPVEVPIAVIPPVIWSDEHLGTKTLSAITPERIFNEIKNFAFSLAPVVFTLLLLVGAIFYLLSPFDVEKIKTGSEYIKWAVIGYFLLLIITSVILALRLIFGGP